MFSFNQVLFREERIMVRRLWMVLLAAVALLGGCASVDPALVRQQVGGKSLAVVSLVNDKVEASWIGTTVFNNEFDRTDRPTWQLPKTAEDAIRGTMPATGPYRALTIRAMPNVSKADLLKGTALTEDLVLVIAPVRYQDTPLNGVGIHQHSALGLKPLVSTFASLEGDLIDLKAGQSVARVVELSSVALPSSVLDAGAKLKPESEAAVSGSVREQVKGSVRAILQQLGLI